MSNSLQLEHPDLSHPDTDQLTAFAEHALPSHEREQTLAHLAACADCRNLVFLAQQTEPEEVLLPQPVAHKTPWFAGWGLAWVAAAALAGIVGLTVHLRTLSAPANPVTTAKIEPPTPVAISTPVPAAKVLPSPPKLQGATGGSVGPNRLQVERLPSQGRNFSEVAPATASPAAGAIHGIAGGIVMGAIPARPAPVTIDGVSAAPMARAAGAGMGAAPPKPLPRQNIVALDQEQMAAKVPAQLPQAAAAGGPSQSQQFQQFHEPPAAAPPAPEYASHPAEITGRADSGSISTMDNATSINMVAGAVSPTGLPSNLPRVSTVANGARSLAIDSAGTLFLSKDRGQTWKSVPAKWNGRAARVSFNAAAKPAAFELTTDSGATWTSRDGQSWKLEKPQP